jgi:hypothetical protein
LQGHFGDDLFYASFSEDVLVGEYARYTFNSKTGEEKATSVISLAQGNLDLIRKLQTGLFGGYAQQVFEESNLGQAARSRTAITTVFTETAQNAMGRLSELGLAAGSSGSGAAGVDIVLPDMPTAAGVPIEAGVPDGEDSTLGDKEGAGVPDDSATVVETDEGEEKCNLDAEEAAPACESEDAEPVENTGAEPEPENVVPEPKVEIDLKSVLAGLAGLGMMSAQNRLSKKSDLKEEETV